MKKEWVLDGASVLYGSAPLLRSTLDYDFSEERNFSYQGLNMDQIIAHLAFFISRLWQIHVFGEGNTRTTAVFLIKYLRSLGFDANNDSFAQHAWYFRNALVRANYSDLQAGVAADRSFLEGFLRNLLLYEENPLHNRDMHIRRILSKKEKPEIGPDIGEGKAEIKPDIEPDIGPDIGHFKVELGRHFAPKTVEQILALRQALPGQTIFGRSEVMQILGVKGSRASEILRKMAEMELIEPAFGFGKGKVHFR